MISHFSWSLHTVIPWSSKIFGTLFFSLLWIILTASQFQCHLILHQNFHHKWSWVFLWSQFRMIFLFFVPFILECIWCVGFNTNFQFSLIITQLLYFFFLLMFQVVFLKANCFFSWCYKNFWCTTTPKMVRVIGPISFL